MPMIKKNSIIQDHLITEYLKKKDEVMKERQHRMLELNISSLAERPTLQNSTKRSTKKATNRSFVMGTAKSRGETPKLRLKMKGNENKSRELNKFIMRTII